MPRIRFKKASTNRPAPTGGSRGSRNRPAPLMEIGR